MISLMIATYAKKRLLGSQSNKVVKGIFFLGQSEHEGE